MRIKIKVTKTLAGTRRGVKRNAVTGANLWLKGMAWSANRPVKDLSEIRAGITREAIL